MTVTSEPSFAVVIPAYNEERGIAACVSAVEAALSKLPNRTALIVVEDGSSDATGEVLAGLEPEFPGMVVLRHERNRGYGAGLRSGTQEALSRGFDYVLFMDSDLTNDPADLARFADRTGEGVDVIKASRYVSGGGVAGVPWWRVSLSRVGNLVARLLFGLPVHDCTNGFRAVRTNLLASVELDENGFAVIMEELYRLRPLARGYAEVPVVLTARSGDLRPSSFSFGPRAMARYLKYPLLSARDRIAGR
jgi:dolichol-phosphate mannosyltransferase